MQPQALVLTPRAASAAPAPALPPVVVVYPAEYRPLVEAMLARVTRDIKEDSVPRFMQDEQVRGLRLVCEFHVEESV